MPDNPPALCPHCGQSIPKYPGPAPAQEVREYDHRGVQLPQRTRIGGIIIPQ